MQLWVSKALNASNKDNNLSSSKGGVNTDFVYLKIFVGKPVAQVLRLWVEGQMSTSNRPKFFFF